MAKFDFPLRDRTLLEASIHTLSGTPEGAALQAALIARHLDADNWPAAAAEIVRLAEEGRPDLAAEIADGVFLTSLRERADAVGYVMLAETDALPGVLALMAPGHAAEIRDRVAGATPEAIASSLAVPERFGDGARATQDGMRAAPPADASPAAAPDTASGGTLDRVAAAAAPAGEVVFPGDQQWAPFQDLLERSAAIRQDAARLLE